MDLGTFENVSGRDFVAKLEQQYNFGINPYEERDQQESSYHTPMSLASTHDMVWDIKPETDEIDDMIMRDWEIQKE